MIIDKLAYSSAIRSKSPFLKSGFAVGALLICVGFGAFLPSAVILLTMMTLTDDCTVYIFANGYSSVAF